VTIRHKVQTRDRALAGRITPVPRPPLRLLRLANPVVRGVLGSRAHRLLSRALIVLEYRGRRSGRVFRIPLQYAVTGDRIVALAVRPERKQWWRAFTERRPASILLAGDTLPVTGIVLDGAERREALRAYVARFPRAAGSLRLGREAVDDALDRAPAAVVAFDPA
jgi:hypothetical protein